MATSENRSSKGSRQDSEYTDIVELWIFRILFDLGGHRGFIRHNGFQHDALANYFQIAHFENDEHDFDRKKPLVVLRKRYAELKARKPKLSKGPLADNLQWLAKRLALSKAEVNVLAFVALSYEYAELVEASETLGDVGRSRLVSHLSTILGVPRDTIHVALQFNSRLARSGLVKVDARTSYSISNSLDTIEGFQDRLFQYYSDPVDLLARYFASSAEPEFSRVAFAYRTKEFDLTGRYLRQALKNRRQGVNVLIYSRPGTGKTQFVRTLARDLGCQLYEVNMEEPEGEPKKGQERFSAYQLGQSLLSNTRRALILFDEVEDVFPPRFHWFFGKDRSQEGRKAWINRILEENPVPAFWITNDTDYIDPATLRRFDIVIDFKSPSRAMRKQMLAQYFKGMAVSQDWLESLAANEDLVPAFIGRASKVVREMNCKTPEETQQTADYLIQKTLAITGGMRKAPGVGMSTVPYRLDVLNADVDVEQLLAGLSHNNEARMCLYGPPGTGKTAFGEHVAKALDRPLIKKPASALISAYIGETEKNLAKMFEVAEDEGAVLLLDEADGFLRDRRGAQHSWELTQVNELMVQMEAYKGIFIASTNLMDELDQASLRRFDLKIHFGYLKPEQAWVLFQQTIGTLDKKKRQVSREIRRRIGCLENLTPGDYATVIRQQRVFGEKFSAEKLLSSLEAECRAKHDGQVSRIGFLN